MSWRHARTLVQTKKRRRETLLPGWAQRGGHGRGEKQETFWRKEFIHGWRIHLFRWRGEDEVTYFRERNRPFSSTKTQAIVGTLRRLLLSSCSGGKDEAKNPGRKTHEFEWVPKGQDCPRGCKFLLVRVLTLYRTWRSAIGGEIWPS